MAYIEVERLDGAFVEQLGRVHIRFEDQDEKTWEISLAAVEIVALIGILPDLLEGLEREGWIEDPAYTAHRAREKYKDIFEFPELEGEVGT